MMNFVMSKIESLFLITTPLSQHILTTIPTHSLSVTTKESIALKTSMTSYLTNLNDSLARIS